MKDNSKSAWNTKVIIKWQNPKSAWDTNIIIKWKRILKVREIQT